MDGLERQERKRKEALEEVEEIVEEIPVVTETPEFTEAITENQFVEEELIDDVKPKTPKKERRSFIESFTSRISDFLDNAE